MIRIVINEIIFIETELNYIDIHHERGKATTFYTLTEMEEVLDSQQFVRVHKSFMINLSKVVAIEGSSLIMTNQFLVNIGEKYRSRLLDSLSPLMLISKHHQPHG